MLKPSVTMNCKGKLLSLEVPLVMGILNLTPDSFYDGGKHGKADAALRQVEKMLHEGASIIDVGGMSSRPGAEMIEEAEELRRVIPIIQQLVGHFPEAILSIDTIRASVAAAAVSEGVHIVNDISAGKLDEKMYETVAALGVPYVLMHMRGKPQNMQTQTEYQDITTEVLDFFIQELGKLRALGVKDIVLDPGFGFSKTVAGNYQLLKQLHVFQILEVPILVGISRKSMVYKPLQSTSEHALNGSTALHMVALQHGAKILRVHDVREAVEVITLWKQLEQMV